MAASNSNAARKKSGSRIKNTAEVASSDVAPVAVEAKKKKDEKSSSKTVATSKVAASLAEASKKSAPTGRFFLWKDSIGRFLKSVRSEMERVSWPSWKELRTSTIVVVMTLLMISMYMGVVDWVFSLLFGTPATGF